MYTAYRSSFSAAFLIKFINRSTLRVLHFWHYPHFQLILLTLDIQFCIDKNERLLSVKETDSLPYLNFTSSHANHIYSYCIISMFTVEKNYRFPNKNRLHLRISWPLKWSSIAFEDHFEWSTHQGFVFLYFTCGIPFTYGRY